MANQSEIWISSLQNVLPYELNKAVIVENESGILFRIHRERNRLGGVDWVHVAYRRAGRPGEWSIIDDFKLDLPPKELIDKLKERNRKDSPGLAEAFWVLGVSIIAPLIETKKKKR